MKISTKKLLDWTIIILDGKFVVKELMPIRQILTDIEATQKSPKIAFDLTPTSYLDSSAITAMLNLQKRLAPKKGRFAVIGPNEFILDILSIVGFDRIISIHTTHESFKESVLKETSKNSR